MKDRIGNKLALSDKVLVELPTSSIVGFIADLQEPGLVLRRNQETPGRLLVSCVIAIPVDAAQNAVGQLVKVYDAAKAEGTQGPSLVTEGSSEPSKAN